VGAKPDRTIRIRSSLPQMQRDPTIDESNSWASLLGNWCPSAKSMSNSPLSCPQLMAAPVGLQLRWPAISARNG
jgi:hypothetical protein